MTFGGYRNGIILQSKSQSVKSIDNCRYNSHLLAETEYHFNLIRCFTRCGGTSFTSMISNPGVVKAVEARSVS